MAGIDCLTEMFEIHFELTDVEDWEGTLASQVDSMSTVRLLEYELWIRASWTGKEHCFGLALGTQIDLIDIAY